MSGCETEPGGFLKGSVSQSVQEMAFNMTRISSRALNAFTIYISHLCRRLPTPTGVILQVASGLKGADLISRVRGKSGSFRSETHHKQLKAFYFCENRIRKDR